ncbi:MAG: general stress protein [Gemmatimonadota bacterium]
MNSDHNGEQDPTAPDNASSPEAAQYRTSATVVGLFTDRDDAARALSDLREAGFSENEIGIAMQDEADAETLRGDATAPAADGAAKGAVSGGLVGGLVGLLGSLLIPGIGPIIAGGVLGSILAGAGIGAATGGIIGALIGLGISKEEAEHFERGFREGGILVTVGADERAMEARAILRDRGADLGPSYTGGSLSSEGKTGASALRPTRNVEGGWNDLEDDGLEYDTEAHRIVEQQSVWSGDNRRLHRDVSYSGPERRMASH